jgi:hypothetical protein
MLPKNGLQKLVRKNLRFAMLCAKGSSKWTNKLVVRAADTEEPPKKVKAKL